MPPIPDDPSAWVKKTIEKSPLVVFSKSFCPYCKSIKKILNETKLNHFVIELDQRPDGSQIQSALKLESGISTVPQVFSRGKFIGDSSKVSKLAADGGLLDVTKSKYDYDLVVIGGGSGGLAASKEAARLGAKVVVLDYVTPTLHGTQWGLGGTCVNVGCIPKKLMHQAALHGHGFEDSRGFGWCMDDAEVRHDWKTMVSKVQDHIRSLNFGYRVNLRQKNVTYLNSIGTLKDSHTVQFTDDQNNVSTITAEHIILAMGERPRYPDIPGKEYAITSDDLFSLDYHPGKTLLIGASYVALECAGFLRGVGIKSTIMVRSILLRGFDQQVANMIGDDMAKHGVEFLRQCVPTKVEKIKDGTPGLYRVTGKYNDGTVYTDEFNTIVVAIGRDPIYDREAMEKLGIDLNKAGRIICSADDSSSVKNIFAIGDINAGKPQLTPVAIQAGRLLVNRLYTASTELMDYVNVPTTVFTPLEYGACGLSEEDAIAKYGEANIEVYHSEFFPLEWKLRDEQDNVGYVKLICNKGANEQVVGFHVLTPNAGEVTQGVAIAMKLGATKADFDRTVGIHPTCAEAFTTLTVTKRSGATAKVTAC